MEQKPYQQVYSMYLGDDYKALYINRFAENIIKTVAIIAMPETVQVSFIKNDLKTGICSANTEDYPAYMVNWDKKLKTLKSNDILGPLVFLDYIGYDPVVRKYKVFVDEVKAFQKQKKKEIEEAERVKLEQLELRRKQIKEAEEKSAFKEIIPEEPTAPSDLGLLTAED